MRKVLFLLLMMFVLCGMEAKKKVVMPVEPVASIDTFEPDRYMKGYVIFSNERYDDMLDFTAKIAIYIEELKDVIKELQEE